MAPMVCTWGSLLRQVPRDHEEQRARGAALGGDHRHQPAQAAQLQLRWCPKGAVKPALKERKLGKPAG